MAKLFIVDFSKDLSQIGLLELFSIHGTVNTVTIVTDQQTGESKCYGFVTMTDSAGAGRAIAALNGSQLGGRQLSVRLAEDKKQVQKVAPSKRPRRASGQQSDQR
ncbi:RNA-binding protein [Mucilaginibacter sp. CAU 1740]|uniref:RNA recognition motif domain-containing protein n=1 Tax=Mucilaginibacter sp. CAU 1740 TaxID=3140365 RepID=UPI00325B14EA